MEGSCDRNSLAPPIILEKNRKTFSSKDSDFHFTFTVHFPTSLNLLFMPQNVKHQIISNLLFLPPNLELESPNDTNAASITPFPPLDLQPKPNKTDPSCSPVTISTQNPATSPPGDELDGVVMFKRAEAEMYQTRADDARREAEGLKRIAAAKMGKIEEEFSRRMGRLRLPEVEERRRSKLQQLQSLERSQREFLNLKMRMEADVRELLLKMDAGQRNLGR